MSDEYDNTNKGVLFTNSFKEHSKQPDVKGDLDVDGVAYKIVGWIRTKKESTEKFFSLSVELRDKLPPAKKEQDPINEILGIVAELGNEPPAETQKPSEGHTKAPKDDTGDMEVPF